MPYHIRILCGELKIAAHVIGKVGGGAIDDVQTQAAVAAKLYGGIRSNGDIVLLLLASICSAGIFALIVYVLHCRALANFFNSYNESYKTSDPLDACWYAVGVLEKLYGKNDALHGDEDPVKRQDDVSAASTSAIPKAAGELEDVTQTSGRATTFSAPSTASSTSTQQPFAKPPQSNSSNFGARNPSPTKFSFSGSTFGPKVEEIDEYDIGDVPVATALPKIIEPDDVKENETDNVNNPSADAEADERVSSNSDQPLSADIDNQCMAVAAAYASQNVRLGSTVEDVDGLDVGGLPASTARPRITEPDVNLMDTATGVLHTDAEAEVILLGWCFRYPEAAQWINGEAADMKVDGVPLAEIEARISVEMQKRKAVIDEQRAERKRLIADPKMRNSLTPRNDGERMEIERLNKTEANEAETAKIMAKVGKDGRNLREREAALADGSYAMEVKAAAERDVQRELATRKEKLRRRKLYSDVLEAVLGGSK